MSKAGARSFAVLHPLGVIVVTARTAGEALRKSYVPGGFRHALGVIEESVVVGGRDTRTAAPFVAFIGEPAALAKGGVS